MKRRDIEAEARRKRWRAAMLRKNGEQQAAMLLYEDALRLYKRVDDRVLQYDVFREMGDTAREMKNFSDARDYYEQARAVFKNKLQPARYWGLLKSLKTTSIMEGDFPRAYRELKQLLNLSPERRNIDLLQELGQVTDQLGDTATSDSYFAQAVALSDNQTTIDILKIWRQVLSRRGNKQLACQWHRLAIILSEQEAEYYSASLDAKPHSFFTEGNVDRAWNRLEALRQELKAMGCDDC